VQLSVEAKYPSNWNEHQTWKCILTACRASGFIVFQHKEFFQGYFFVLHCQKIKCIFRMLTKAVSAVITLSVVFIHQSLVTHGYVSVFKKNSEK